MSTVWEAAHACAGAITEENSLRLTNLVIAGAARHHGLLKKKAKWDGATARAASLELALSPIGEMSTDGRLWTRLAELASEAQHLGATSEGMHSWAAAYQRASTTQKALGAYATHNAFASALARITMGPLERRRIYRVVDPSVGAGNLLLAAVEQYGRSGTDAERKKFILALHGVEVDPRARELCCLLIWLAGAGCGVTLGQVANNIKLANALTMDWWADQDLYEVLLMNPPWESLRHKVDEDPGGERAATSSRLSKLLPGVGGLPLLYTAQGTGDRNLFKAFVELVPHLLKEGGRLGALLPAAFASDAGLTELRKRYLQQFEIARWTTFENRGGYFPIDSRYKFGLLAATRSDSGTKRLSVRGFAVEPDEVDAPHISLGRQDIALIGRKYHIIPELSRSLELEILRVALRAGTALFEVGALGRVVYRRELDLSLDRELFHHIESKKFRRKGDGTFIDAKGKDFVPLLEGRSVGAYDCFQKTWVGGKGRTAAWRENGDQPLSECSPQYVISSMKGLPLRVAVCDVTASTNTRTVMATLVPSTWRCGNTAPVLEFDSEMSAFAGLGILNSLVFDWVARRLTSGLHLNKFILEGLVWPTLNDGELEQLAHASWSICVSKPRSGLSGNGLVRPPWIDARQNSKNPTKPIAAASTIEMLVAKGLGLSPIHMEGIYDPDRTHRRGFWRYFDADPSAMSVVEAALKASGQLTTAD
jgi:hypothetical protein